MTYRHKFKRRGLWVHWTLLRIDPEPVTLVAAGRERTKSRAWDSSIAAIPPFPTRLWEPCK